MSKDANNQVNEDLIDKQMFDVFHPKKYAENFNNCTEFHTHMIAEYVIKGDVMFLIPTLRKLLSSYEKYEMFDQCIILKDVIDSVRRERRNKIYNKNKFKNG